MTPAERARREERILSLAAKIIARRKKQARADAFAATEMVTIRWNVPDAVQKRLGLSFGYDGVDVPAARVAPMVRAIMRKAQ